MFTVLCYVFRFSHLRKSIHLNLLNLPNLSTYLCYLQRYLIFIQKDKYHSEKYRTSNQIYDK